MAMSLVLGLFGVCMILSSLNDHRSMEWVSREMNYLAVLGIIIVIPPEKPIGH
jgi:hypothetical protein